MKVLMEMGHGDEIVFGDRNFPGNSSAKILIRYDGCSSIPFLLDAILPLFPLDYAAEFSCILMHPAIKQKQAPIIWKEIIDMIKIGANSFAIGSMITFKDYNIIKIKQHLFNKGYKVRF
jgi:L-fucose mutarotase